MPGSPTQPEVQLDGDAHPQDALPAKYEERRRNFERRRDRGHVDPQEPAAVAAAASAADAPMAAPAPIPAPDAPPANVDTRDVLRATSAALMRAERRNKQLRLALETEKTFKVSKDDGCNLATAHGYSSLRMGTAEVATAERVCALLADNGPPAKTQEKVHQKRRD